METTNPFIAANPQFAPETIKEFRIVDTQTGDTVRSYGPAQKVTARRYRDKLDNQYGGYRYTVKTI